ncbi:MAG: alpha/beta fold hydrolase [Planctomycetaceae bacterium]
MMKTLWQYPTNAIAAVVLAHGAGAGMSHKNMQAIADALERQLVATLRFNFPFIDAGRSRTDPPAVAAETIAAAFENARQRTDLPLWLGGHSFGGRMASHAVLDHGLTPAGLIFCSFPLHPAGRLAVKRAEHLQAVRQPMLFLSGTRDELADRELLEQVVGQLPTAQLHWLETADHSYHVLKRTRRSEEHVFAEMARVTREFIARVMCSD